MVYNIAAADMAKLNFQFVTRYFVKLMLQPCFLDVQYFFVQEKNWDKELQERMIETLSVYWKKNVPMWIKTLPTIGNIRNNVSNQRPVSYIWLFFCSIIRGFKYCRQTWTYLYHLSVLTICRWFFCSKIPN